MTITLNALAVLAFWLVLLILTVFVRVMHRHQRWHKHGVVVMALGLFGVSRDMWFRSQGLRVSELEHTLTGGAFVLGTLMIVTGYALSRRRANCR